MSDHLVHPELPSRVRIVEAGARGGPQNEAAPIHARAEAKLLDRLPRDDGIVCPVLVPNLQGLQQAMDKGCRDVAVFGATWEAFSRKNIICSVAESIDRFHPAVERTRADMHA